MAEQENPAREKEPTNEVVGNCVLQNQGRLLMRYRRVADSVSVPETVEEIGSFAFWRCPATQITLPPGVRRIGERAFLWCRHLTEVSLPEGLEEIGEGAFCGCGSLREMRLPESLRVLCTEALDGTGITQLTLPKNMELLEWHALRGCRLQRLTIQGRPRWDGELCPDWDLPRDAALVADALDLNEYPAPYTEEHGLRGFVTRWWSGEPISPEAVERFRRYLTSQYRQYRSDRAMFRLMATLQAIPTEQLDDALSRALEENDPALTIAVLSAWNEANQKS